MKLSIPLNLGQLADLKAIYSWQYIGELYGVTHHTVIGWADKLGFMYKKRTPAQRPNKRCIKLSDKNLIEMSVGMSQMELALKLGTNRANVQSRLAKLGATLPCGEGRQNRFDRDHISLTPEQEELILGTLLGDGCLCKMRGGFGLVINHSEKQSDYVAHKKEILGGSNICTSYKSGFGSVMHRFTFQNAFELRRIASVCLPQGKKYVTQEWLSKLTWRSIAYWYMDDGSLALAYQEHCGKKFTYASIRLCTEGFSDEEVELIIFYFNNLGFHFTKSRHKRRASSVKEPGYTLSLGRGQEVTRFLQYIQPYVIPSMEYKLRCLRDESFARFQFPQNHNEGTDIEG